jgi:isoleucyl-tRNA synthetase
MSDGVKSDVSKREEEILKFWNERDIFNKTLQKGGKEYIFYDGPPFATGLPHYGHIVASVIKDVVPRYWTMRGYHVPRVWGWDCHGLPIENIVEKELGFQA